MDWIGVDAHGFGGKWEAASKDNSTAVKFRDSLKKFGENLTDCANKYQTAHEEAYNEANGLPK